VCKYWLMRLYRSFLGLACVAMLAVTTLGTHIHLESHHPSNEEGAHAKQAATHQHAEPADFASTVHGSFDLDHLIGHMLDGDLDVDQGDGLTGKAQLQPPLVVALFMLVLVPLLTAPTGLQPARRRARPPPRSASFHLLPPSQAPPDITQAG
jgi:hypothetical protein